ncbi:hypothetical protein J437_LFUL005521 [Ladona fulva]|uniref:Hyaluronan-mediated motility receptor C-terminal domain-containing protein n=1 Tax=Ladona fulva TaxID=123851 RepID=A0A8K0K1S8_LADFU|nr:hypothetical protein J437_LFUL005521 [Ladona fulva]
MAFAKAKIQRFNEVIGCAPPPGTYQPKWQEKPLLGVFEKGSRFNDKKSKTDLDDTPMKTDESFSSSTSATSVKDENAIGESVVQKTCDCNITIDAITKKYEDTIESLTERLKVLTKYEDGVEQSTDAENVNMNTDPSNAHEMMGQTYQQEIIEYRLKIAELQDTIDCLTAEKNVLKMDYFKMKKNIGELEEEIKTKSRKLSEAESLAESRRESIDILRRGVHHLKADLEDSKVQAEDLQCKFHNINEELILERSKKEDLQAKYKNAVEEISKKSEEIQDLTNSLNKKIIIIEHEKRIRAQEAEKLSNELDKMKQLNDADQVIHRKLEKDLCTTRKELANALSKVEELSFLREGMESSLNDMMTDSENVFVNGESVTADTIIHFLKSLIKAKNEVDLLNKELESEIEKKELHIQNLEQLIGPFREQLENYEQERQALENLTKQTKGEYESLSLQHAALLGHQNHKQKIQYMEIEDLREKLRQKERTIAKLRKQSKEEPKTPTSKALHRSRKENTLSNTQ